MISHLYFTIIFNTIYTFNIGAIRGGQATADKWKRTRELAMSGDIEDIDDEHFIKYYSTIKRIKADNPPPVIDLPAGTKHMWYFGSSGTGKSMSARQEHPGLFDKAANTKWWCGYENEEVVLIDDFDKEHAKYMGFHLKRWADRYAFPAEMKGGNVKHIRPKLIIVTSNWDIKELWRDEPNTLQPLLRRFQRVHFRSLGERIEAAVDQEDLQTREGYDPSAGLAPNFRLPTTANRPFANIGDDTTRDNMDLSIPNLDFSFI